MPKATNLESFLSSPSSFGLRPQMFSNSVRSIQGPEDLSRSIKTKADQCKGLHESLFVTHAA